MHDPTEEQEDAIENFKTGENLKINAFAGTGKTSTLEMLGQNCSSKGLYLAFNKSIAQEAERRFSQNVTCRTTHSVAYRSVPSSYKNNSGKMANKLWGNQVATILNLRDIDFRINAKERVEISSTSQGFLITQTIAKFCQSADPQLDWSHVPQQGAMMTLGKGQRNELRGMVLKHADNIWQRMITPSAPEPLGHDGYLKLWALREPRLPTDFILLDEAQDTNPVMLGVLAHQDAQIIYVGDRHQQIYEWRGAVNAMENVETTHESYLTRSFRFGPEIAAAASHILDALKEERPLKGNKNRKSYIGCEDPRTILSRTNAQVITNVVQRQMSGQTVHIIGGARELINMLNGVVRLKENRPSDIPEFFGFVNWQQVIHFSESEEGEHLKTFVKLVETHGEQKLIKSLENCNPEEEGSDVIVSTGHKSKGREWDTVRLDDDFAVSKMDKDGNELPVDSSELRLLYVAATRGRIAVDISPALCEQFKIERNPLGDKPPKLASIIEIPKPAPKRTDTSSTQEKLRESPPIRTAESPTSDKKSSSSRATTALGKLWDRTKEVATLYTGTFIVVMVLNQLLFFGFCLNPVCLIAAMPHVLFITVVIGTWLNKRNQWGEKSAGIGEKFSSFADSAEKLSKDFESKAKALNRELGKMDEESKTRREAEARKKRIADFIAEDPDD